MRTLVCLCLLINPLVFGQTNNVPNFDISVQCLEDLYILKILDKTKFKLNLSGQVVFDKDQFGGTKRIISYPAFKILF